MTRQSRMLLVVGAMALVGVSALAMLANRYSRLQPTRSVADVQPAPAVALPAPTPAQPAEPSPAPAPADAPIPVAEGSVPPAAAPSAARPAAVVPAEPSAEQRAVEGFVAARRFVREYLDKNETARRQFELELDGKLETQDRNPMYLAKMAGMKLGRGKVLVETGMTEEQYRGVRDAFRVWHDGGDLEDAALRAAFEERRAELEPLHLGKLEPLDDL